MTDVELGIFEILETLVEVVVFDWDCCAVELNKVSVLLEVVIVVVVVVEFDCDWKCSSFTLSKRKELLISSLLIFDLWSWSWNKSSSSS